MCALAREQRRLAAIVSADVAGYSRLMGGDESGTLAALKAVRREIVDPYISAHGGRIVKTTGDGLLLEFPSVVDAMRCVVEVQTAMAAHGGDIVFRIGVNLGDIIIDGDDIFGDGVNIAARLQEIATPGGVCVSSRVHDDARDRLEALFEDGGAQSLKNIARPVQVWRWSPGPPAPIVSPALALPDKPSIAVLPFQNMSGDPEQDYFADGMVEDIITALSRFTSLFVIARNSSFTYKGRAVDIKQVGRELGVRYVLEGSVRKAASRVRITGQLIDSETGAHLWADRFDGSLENVFELQDQVTASVAGAVGARVDEVEIERARRKPVENLGAYDCFLRGMAKFHELLPESVEQARTLFYRAIELEPEFVPPYAVVTRCHINRKITGRVVDKDADMIEVRRLATHVAAAGRNDALSLTWAGYALVSVCGDHAGGGAMMDQALSLNPNLAACWLTRAALSLYQGNHEAAIEESARALRLNPIGFDANFIEGIAAAAHFLIGRYDETLLWSARILARRPWAIVGLQAQAAAYALTGNLDAARKAMTALLQAQPTMTVASQRDVHPYLRPQDLAKWLDAFRLAGMPE